MTLCLLSVIQRHGIPLRRFTLSQDLFEARDDLALVDIGAGELAVRQSTFMNVTLGTWMPTVRRGEKREGLEGGQRNGRTPV